MQVLEVTLDPLDEQIQENALDFASAKQDLDDWVATILDQTAHDLRCQYCDMVDVAVDKSAMTRLLEATRNKLVLTGVLSAVILPFMPIIPVSVIVPVNSVRCEYCKVIPHCRTRY